MAEGEVIDLKTRVTFDFTGFEMFEGEPPSSLLKKDGDYRLKVNHITPDKFDMKDGAKVLVVRVRMNVLDEDEQGALLKANIFLEGKDKDGKPMDRQYGQFLVASGQKTADQILELTGKNASLEAIQKSILGKEVLVRARARRDVIKRAGQPDRVIFYSEVASWLDPKRYEEDKAAGNTRWPHNIQQAGNGAVPDGDADAAFLSGGPGAAAPKVAGATSDIDAI